MFNDYDILIEKAAGLIEDEYGVDFEDAFRELACMEIPEAMETAQNILESHEFASSFAKKIRE